MYTWVSTEFRQHGIPPSKRNSVKMEFRRHGIPSTRNSVDTEFRQHGIPPTRNLAEFRTQKYAKFRGIPQNLANFNSQSLQYVRI
jgi:hypothetical protein